MFFDSLTLFLRFSHCSYDVFLLCFPGDCVDNSVGSGEGTADEDNDERSHKRQKKRGIFPSRRPRFVQAVFRRDPPVTFPEGACQATLKPATPP